VAQATEDGATLYVVSHTQTNADGADFTHYGLVRIPGEGTADVALPVLVVHHGDDDGLSVSGFLGALALYPALADETVQVAPVFRSETLVADAGGLSGTYAAGGTPSPWDRDVDDAIGLLNVALALFPDATDPAQIGALGFSRGGATALLHAIRDDRVNVVTDYFGPSDFFNTTAVFLAREAVAGNPDVLGLPGLQYLTDTVLTPLADETLSYEDARLELVRRSPGYFGARLPAVQVHHHREDPVVPVSISQAFFVVLQDNPPAGRFDGTLYNNILPDGVASPHDPAAMPASLPATQAFIGRHIGGE
jgi:hypothetical protein